MSCLDIYLCQFLPKESKDVCLGRLAEDLFILEQKQVNTKYKNI